MSELERQRIRQSIKQCLLCQRVGVSTKTYAALRIGECNRLDVYLALKAALGELEIMRAAKHQRC